MQQRKSSQNAPELLSNLDTTCGRMGVAPQPPRCPNGRARVRQGSAARSETTRQGPQSTRGVTNKPDPWLERYLEIIGRANPDGIGRGLHPRHCPHCTRTTLAGLDADVAAFPVYLDPASLNATGEAAAQLLGIATYALIRRNTGLQADRRDAAAIRRRPPTICDVVAEHRCNLHLPAHLYRPVPRPVRATDKPPF